ncbi:MAG: M23 family metallopeptidase [Oscillospiraceae bacterium]|nr:M23 family metallopeptidase [Oscillospiraceae bacterium]
MFVTIMNKRIICKAFTSMLLAMTLIVTYATALPATHATEYSEAETWSIETDVDISGDIIGEVSTLDGYSVNATAGETQIVWTIPSGSAMVVEDKVFMSEGDTVIFNLSYTLASASIRVGVYSATSGYQYMTASNGLFVATLTIEEPGVKYIRILNTSSSEVQVIGTYTINATSPFTYMFTDTENDACLSSVYGEYRSGTDKYHYAIDIIGSKTAIKGRSVYNTLAGTVKYCELFSDGITCVAVLHENGLTSRYLHMDISSNIYLGKYVATGEQVGTVSDKGSPNAFHLHYDLNTAGYVYGTYFSTSNTIDPTYVFPNVQFTVSQ